MIEESNLSHQIRHEHDDLRLPASVDYIDCRPGGMELKEVTSELLALRKLYGLLQTREDGELSAVEIQSDKRARLLLKDLLDQASERLLKMYSEIITNQLSTRAPCSSSSPLQPADSTQAVRTSSPSIRSGSGFNRTILNTNPQLISKEAPRLHEIFSNKPGISNRSCIICDQHSTVQQAWSEETKRGPVMDSESMQHGHLPEPSALVQRRASHLALDKSNQKPPRQKKIQRTNGEISPRLDISYAIKRIEAQISVLQHLSRLANPLESAARPTKEHETRGPSRITRNVTNLPSPLRENHKSTAGMMVARTEIPSWSTSQVQPPSARTSSQTSNFVHGFRVPKSNMTKATFNEESLRKVVQQRLLVPSENTTRSVPSASSSNRMLTRRETSASHRNTHRLALMEHKGDNKRPPPGGNTARKMSTRTPHQMESEESSSGSADSSTSYSSSWTSGRQTSPSSSYISEDQSRSYTDDTDFSRGSRSESEDSSSFSSYPVPSPDRCVEPPPSKKVHGPTRRPRSPNPGKAIGRLRKIKNKLGLIFHHHHHHHHHHHGNEEDRVDNKSKWKQMGNSIFHGPRKQQADGGREVVGKLKKPVDKRSQGGHFHALVEGLLRHVRHNNKKKKLKPPDPKGLRRNNRKRKKLHWWQMARRRGGVKLPKGGHRPKLKFPKHS